MPTTRRDFLKSSALAGGALSLGMTGRPRPSRHPLDILILGGTTFLGPHQIKYALDRGHSVSTFTRGQTQPTIYRRMFRDVEQLVGDRENDHRALEGRRWDVVIDNSGRQVEWTRTSAELLRESADIYVYTSSTGVYYPYIGTDLPEDANVPLVDTADVPEDQRPSYGVMKALSENVVRETFGEDRAIIVRPTYIVGPADPQVTRFPYWPVRLRQGGEVLVPGNAHDPVQYIDVRDLTEWMIRLAEQGTGGTFNVAAPPKGMGIHEFVHGVKATTASVVEWVYVSDYDFLREHNVQFMLPWLMPVGEYEGSARINVSRAMANGLTLRPLAETTQDVLAWWDSNAVSDEQRARLGEGERSMMQREPEIIAAWKARRG